MGANLVSYFEFAPLTLASLQYAAYSQSRSSMCVEPNGNYSICLAAPIHQIKGFNTTADCTALNKLLSSGYPTGLQGGLRWNATNCGIAMTPGVKTSDRLFYSCTVFKSVVEYSRMVQAVWALAQPSVAKGFANSFVNSE